MKSAPNCANRRVFRAQGALETLVASALRVAILSYRKGIPIIKLFFPCVTLPSCRRLFISLSIRRNFRSGPLWYVESKPRRGAQSPSQRVYPDGRESVKEVVGVQDVEICQLCNCCPPMQIATTIGQNRFLLLGPFSVSSLFPPRPSFLRHFGIGIRVCYLARL